MKSTISSLRASREETLKRATGRAKLNRETNIELVETMWEQFADLGEIRAQRDRHDAPHHPATPFPPSRRRSRRGKTALLS